MHENSKKNTTITPDLNILSCLEKGATFYYVAFNLMMLVLLYKQKFEEHKLLSVCNKQNKNTIVLG